MTHRYPIGGVAFLADEPLPDLDQSGFADADLRASFVTDPEFRSLASVGAQWLAGPMGLVGAVDGDARRCWMPGSGASKADRAWLLRQMAPVFSAAIERLVLHAGGARIRESVVAFVGPSGAGKSTLAQFLADRGHTFVADDLLAVRFEPNPSVPVDESMSPLSAIYFLDRGDADSVSVTPLEAVDTLHRLIRHGFGEHGDSQAWRFQFDAYHRIVETTPGFDLTVPDDLSALPRVADVLADPGNGPRSRSEHGGAG